MSQPKADETETRHCEVCGLKMIQQYPGDPVREWYWYCPAEGFVSHIAKKIEIRESAS